MLLEGAVGYQVVVVGLECRVVAVHAAAVHRDVGLHHFLPLQDGDTIRAQNEHSG